MKKMFKMGCLGIMGLFALIVVVALFSGGGEETTTTVTKESADKPKEEKKAETNAKIGDTLKVGNVEFKVSEVSKATSVGGEYGEKSKGEYLMVKVSVANKGNEALIVDSSFFTIKADGKEYSADDVATALYTNDDADFFYSEINPDIALEGTVVFDLPKDVHSKDLTLNVQTGLFGTEQGQISLK